MSGIFGGKACEGCDARDRLIAVLTQQLQERERTMLALVNTQAHRQRFPEPKAPPQPVAEQQPVVVTPEMQRGQIYTPPLGRNPYEVERDFEVEEESVS
jgi:hypothetical protein